MLINVHSREKWNGETLPNFIKNILDNSDGSLYFGGGSLIRSRFFNEENWGEQDYDFWAEKKVNNKVYAYIKKNMKIMDELISDVYFENYQGVGFIDKIHTITLENMVIQLIDIKKTKDINKVIQYTDLTFTSCLYNGNEIFYGVDPQHIRGKKGDIIIHDNVGNSYFPHCYLISSKFKKLNERVKKYLSRGFTFTNLCPWCKLAINPQVSHLKECLLFTHLGDDSTIKKSYEDIYNIIIEENNSELITAFLAVILENREINKFHFYFDKIKPSNLCVGNNFLIITAAKLGIYSIVKKIYDYSCQETAIKINIEEPDHTLIKIAIKNNYQNIAKFLCKINPKYYLETYEDAIISFRIKSIFDVYLEQRNKEMLYKLFPLSKKANKEMTCGVCKYTESEIELECNHTFCDVCIITWFQNNNNCPYCQKYVESKQYF